MSYNRRNAVFISVQSMKHFPKMILLKCDPKSSKQVTLMQGLYYNLLLSHTAKIFPPEFVSKISVLNCTKT